MKTYRVGVCDSDLEYAAAIMDYSNENKESGIKMTMFSSMKALAQYLSVQDLDLILTDDISRCEKVDGKLFYCDVKAVKLVEFKDESEGWQMADSEEEGIFKYQQAAIICKQIKNHLVFKSENVTKVTEVIGVFSPIGRCGKTLLAKTLAGYDEVRGGLYVSLEDYSVDRTEINTDILYLLKTNSSDIKEAINHSIFEENGIHILGISGTYLDIHDVSSSDINTLVRLLLETGRFTSIVFDIGSSVLGDLSVFECFDRLYMPVLGDEKSKQKIEVFNKLMKDVGKRSILSKFTPVDVPDSNLGEEELVKTVWKLRTNGNE